jgi:hypothetical protein
MSLTIDGWKTYHCVSCIALCEENQRLRDALTPFAAMVLITDPATDPQSSLQIGRVIPEGEYPTATFADCQRAAEAIGLRDNTGGDDVRADGS